VRQACEEPLVILWISSSINAGRVGLGRGRTLTVNHSLSHRAILLAESGLVLRRRGRHANFVPGDRSAQGVTSAKTRLRNVRSSQAHDRANVA
jgi:hypothetical protein